MTKHQTSFPEEASKASITSMERSIRNSFGSLRRIVLFRALLLGALAICREATALMIPLTTTDLVDRASCIVEGRVTSLSSRWATDHSVIITEVGIDVTDILSGSTNHVTFFYKGGVVDDVEQRVSDMPVVKADQEILVFLRSPTSAEAQRDPAVAAGGIRYTLVGAAQGLYRIESGRAVRDGFTIIGDPAAIERNVDLTALKARIRERLGSSRREGGGL